MAKAHSSSKTPMTTPAVARIYSATATAGNGAVPKGGFGARAARAAAANQSTGAKRK
jgi:hypothetical protein